MNNSEPPIEYEDLKAQVDEAEALMESGDLSIALGILAKFSDNFDFMQNQGYMTRDLQALMDRARRMAGKIRGRMAAPNLGSRGVTLGSETPVTLKEAKKFWRTGKTKSLLVKEARRAFGYGEKWVRDRQFPVVLAYDETWAIGFAKDENGGIFAYDANSYKPQWVPYGKKEWRPS